MLQAEGIGKGARVAVQLTKRMEFLYLHFAVLSVGAITLPLNPEYREGEVGYFLSDSDSSLFVTDAERYRRAAGAIRSLKGVRTLLVDGADLEGAGSLPDRLAAAPSRFRRTWPAGGDDVAMICYTSGTTGRSKGADDHAPEPRVEHAGAFARRGSGPERDVLLHVLPLFHVHGLNVATAREPLRRIDDRHAREVRAAKGVGRAREGSVHPVHGGPDGLPAAHGRVGEAGEKTRPARDAGRSSPAPRRFPRSCSTGSERATGFPILERYGMTETGMIASNRIDPAAPDGEERGRIRSRASRYASMRKRRRRRPPGEVGEVWIRGETCSGGTGGCPTRRGTPFAEGWFRSGDLGFRDPNDGGRLFLVGRAKELIISGGYNVYPKEVENVLDSHEAVKESAVVGLPDEEFGEKVAAAVVLKDGGPVAPEVLAAHCRTRLASYKCPSGGRRRSGTPAQRDGEGPEEPDRREFSGRPLYSPLLKGTGHAGPAEHVGAAEDPRSAARRGFPLGKQLLDHLLRLRRSASSHVGWSCPSCTSWVT